MKNEKEKIHVFEAAKLGKAPFRILGVSEERGPKKTVMDGVEVSVGAPGQPMGSCRYCGQAIAECWTIRSADGNEFIVGSTCVNKAGDAGLRSQMAPYKRKLRHAREEKRINAAKELLENREDIRKQLTTVESPNRYSASMLEHVEWIMKNAGNAGMIRAARVIEKAEKMLKDKK